MKIRFKLVKFERSLVFQVLAQDIRFISLPSRAEIEFKSSNGLKISSYSSPDISSKGTIYLRGECKNCNYDLTSINFRSNLERDNYFDKVIFALKDWSENWEGFKEKSKEIETTSTNEDIFEF